VNKVTKILEAYKKSSIVSTVEADIVDKEAAITMIIPSADRVKYTKILCGQIQKAISNCEYEINVIFVEHNDKKHIEWVSDYGFSYVFIKRAAGEKFNKSKSFNYGAIYAKPTQYFLLHDVDIMFKKEFFTDLIENIHDSDFLFCSSHRQFINVNHAYSDLILNGKKTIEGIHYGNGHCNPTSGKAPAGSILVSSKTYFEVGGHDEFFTEYSFEDAIFLKKVMAVTGNINEANEPATFLYHLEHPNHLVSRICKAEDVLLHDTFLSLTPTEMRQVIGIKSQSLNNLKNSIK